MPDRAEIAGTIVDIVSEKLNKPKDDITEAMSFINDLGADSLDQVELIMDFEDKFDMQIPEEEAEKIVTIGDAVQYVESHVESE